MALRLFDPDRLPDTIAQLADASTTGTGTDQRAAAARRRAADADAKLDRYRQALEAGADPGVVAGWIADAQRDRLSAEEELSRLNPQPQALSTDDIETLVTDIRDTWGNLSTALGQADGQDKATLLSELGVAISYDPVTRTARVTCTPACVRVSCRRGEWTLSRTPGFAFDFGVG